MANTRKWWWPFGQSGLDETTEKRLKMKCGLAQKTLQNCKSANVENLSVCDALEKQVMYCMVEILNPKVATEYQRCFMRVVNSKGKESYGACDEHVKDMRKCLNKYGIHPAGESRKRN